MESRHTTLVIIFCVLVAALVAVWAVLPTGALLSDRGGNVSSSSDSGLTIDSYAVWEEAGRCFILEVANTRALRRQGLSGRESLAEDKGMLFTYSVSAEYGYWMKDMNFPIDIIWLDENDRIVTIANSVSPETYPRVLYPTDSARKVIEVSAGVVDQLELKTGDELSVSATTTTPPVDCAML